MSLPLLGAEDERQSNVSIISSSPSVDCVSHNANGLKERNYLGLSDCSSVDSSAACSLPEESDNNLNLKATELRLGLPGSQSPKREPELCMLGAGNLDEKPLFPFLPSKDEILSSAQKTVVLGNKRGFSDTIDGFAEVRNAAGAGKFNGNSGTNVMTSARDSGSQLAPMNESTKKLHERSRATSGTIDNQAQVSNNTVGAPAAKAQVVGWPPIKSFRKNTLAATSKNNEEVDGKPGPGALLVKVSMDGAPYMRKVDMRTYSSYQELSSALEKMFSCFMIDQYGFSGALGRETLGERKLKDLQHGSECVLTYEDKDGDWMLVGDVPWEMFIDSCKRLKIMKSSDAIGLAPRAVEKSKNQA